MLHYLNNGIGELASCYFKEIIASLLVCISNLSSIVIGSAVLCIEFLLSIDFGLLYACIFIFIFNFACS